MCNHVWEVKTNYLSGVATETCQVCNEVKEVPGTFIAIMDGIKDKKIKYRTRAKNEYPENYLAQGAQWKVKGKIER